MFHFIKHLLIDGCVCNGVTIHSCDYFAIDYTGARAMRSDHYAGVERVKMRMVSWMCGASLSDRQPRAELRIKLRIDGIVGGCGQTKQACKVAWACKVKE